MALKKPNIYMIILATGFCIPLIFAAMVDFNLTKFVKPNSSFETLFALTFVGLWPAAIMFQNSMISLSKNGFMFLIFSDCINMSLYIFVCCGIYISRKIKASEFRPAIILISYFLGVVAAGALSFLMILR